MNKCKKWLFVLVFCGCSISALLSPAASISAYAMEDITTVEPRADITEWRFKVENGKLYRRLYNCSTANWITEWEYVGEVDNT